MGSLADGLLTTIEQKAAPEYAALLVVDVQNDFVADGGFFSRIGADVRTIQDSAIPPLLRLIEKAREAGVLVVFIQAIYDPEHLSDAMRERNLRGKLDIPRCLTGSWGAGFYAVRPLPGEPVVIKHRYSAFPKTELDALLKRHGIRSLLLTGVSTDTCVESTGRDAYFIDYYVTMVSDCCGAFSARDHENALGRFARDYGTVATSGEIVDAWERSGALRPSLATAHADG